MRTSSLIDVLSEECALRADFPGQRITGSRASLAGRMREVRDGGVREKAGDEYAAFAKKLVTNMGVNEVVVANLFSLSEWPAPP
jgi:hypothetical protein